MTDSGVLCPFPEGVGCGRVPRPARALGCFRGELRLRVADPPLDERPVGPPFDARLVERGLDEPPPRAPDPRLDERPVERLLDVPAVARDLEELDEPPRRGDVLGWAMGASYRANPFLNTLLRRTRCNPLCPLRAGTFSSEGTQRYRELLAALLRHVGRVKQHVR